MKVIKYILSVLTQSAAFAVMLLATSHVTLLARASGMTGEFATPCVIIFTLCAFVLWDLSCDHIHDFFTGE